MSAGRYRPGLSEHELWIMQGAASRGLPDGWQAATWIAECKRMSRVCALSRPDLSAAWAAWAASLESTERSAKSEAR